LEQPSLCNQAQPQSLSVLLRGQANLRIGIKWKHRDKTWFTEMG